jgi:hypothetical protein
MHGKKRGATGYPAIVEHFSAQLFCLSWKSARFTKDMIHVCIFLVCVVHFADCYMKPFSFTSTSKLRYKSPQIIQIFFLSHISYLRASEIITNHRWLEYYLHRQVSYWPRNFQARISVLPTQTLIILTRKFPTGNLSVRVRMYVCT